ESVVDGTLAADAGCLRGVRVRGPRGANEIEVDCLAVSGGFEPNLSLHVQRRGGTRYDARTGAAVPSSPLPRQWIAGAANGTAALADCVAEGAGAASEALASLGVTVPAWTPPEAPRPREDDPSLLWRVAAPDGDESRSFVDLYRDATVAGIGRAVEAGIR